MIAPIYHDLTWEQVDYAWQVAKRRVERSLREGHKDQAGYVGDPLAIVGVGCEGELAFHDYFGLVWDETDTFRKPDWNWYCEIRMAQCRMPRPPAGFGTLIHRPRDDPRNWFTLVAGRAPHYVLLGWIEGERARQIGELKPEAGRPDAWWVHNKLLHKDYEALLSR